jgi:hypothetical protein
LGLTTGGNTLSRKDRERKCVTIAVNVTESEKNAIEEYVTARSLDTATIVRCLIQVLISGKMTFPELLQRYMAFTASGIVGEPSGPRMHRINIRLSQKEKEDLAVLAARAFSRPGEYVRTLLRLLVIGIITLSEFWE